MNDLEAQFMGKKPAAAPVPAFVIEDNNEEEEVIEFNDNDAEEFEPVFIPKKTFSYASATSQSQGAIDNNAHQSQGRSAGSAMTVEELEAQLLKGMVVSPKSPVSQLVGAGPPPGLTASKSEAPLSGPLGFTASSNSTNSTVVMSSTAPLLKNDPNREFMNRFERNLIMKIHTTQLTTETPLMDDFYYQALTKRKSMNFNDGAGPSLLYFPLPSAADRQKELQRRERRRKQREREREKEREKEGTSALSTSNSASANVEINAELVLGKVSHSTSRKPRQQLQIPSNSTNADLNDSNQSLSLHEKVMKGIESVYNAIIAVEDYYLLLQEEENSGEGVKKVSEEVSLKDLMATANEVFIKELNLKTIDSTNHEFIHFLTIPKGRAVIGRILKLLNEEAKGDFLSVLIEHFDFLEIVRPETSLTVVDAFIAQVLSPLVAFVGEAEWSVVVNGLKALFAKRSFVWIALTKAGTVLLCILLSRLEILKASLSGEDATGNLADEAVVLTEKMFDGLEGHLLEFFSPSDPSRDFYAWQCLALLAMNVESDRKRAMILELRDKILEVVEGGDERAVKNLNVFLNALGLDASQLK